MSEKTEKRSFWEKFRHKYRLSIYRDETFEELINLRLTKLNVLGIVGTGTFVFLIIVISVIAYTPARELIPGYPNEKTIRNIYLNNYRLDSLEIEIAKRDAYFENMRRIISGEKVSETETNAEQPVSRPNLTYNNRNRDSVLRNLVTDDQFGLSITENRKLRPSLFNILFFPPVKGLVTNSFSSIHEHYGTDIVTSANEVVKATLPGTVTMSGWTIETGNVIQIQHEDNIISIYKHNAELLKHAGDRVKAGDPIAIIGNSGELTTGPHLHFELWYNGSPLNPQDYISF
ncbi:MAG TPA: M23 family metallopeptidase [Bacteroidales bacterium]|nr:M23 family metallopeptidase [Bacteroidales bacterium]